MEVEDVDHDEEQELNLKEASEEEVQKLIEEFEEIKEKVKINASYDPVSAYIAKAGATPPSYKGGGTGAFQGNGLRAESVATCCTT